MVTTGPATWRNRSMNKSKSPSGEHRSTESAKAAKAARDNHANQLNPNNDEYYRARGLPGRPDGSGGGNPSKPQKG